MSWHFSRKIGISFEWYILKFYSICFGIILLSNIDVGGQCNISRISFTGGERVTYDAVYNWGFIWVEAGEVEFTVKKTEYKEQPAFYIKSYGRSLPGYDWLFKVRDLFHGYINPQNLTPYWFERKTSEGGFKTHNRYSFNYRDSLIYTKVENSDSAYKEDTIMMQPCTYDLLSAIYACRSIDFNKFKVQDTIPITTIIDNEVYNLYIRYLGQENLKTKDKKVYDCLKFSVLLVEGTIFEGGEDLFVWVSNDENRIPILVEAKILIGSVKAVVNTIEGTLTPVRPISQE